MEIVIRKGTMEDVEGFLSLLQEVRNEMEHKDWFYLDPPEFVRKMMKNGRMQLWVAMDGTRLIAAFDVLIPGLDAYNYGYELGLPEEDLLRVVNMDTVVVRPAYRGLGLHRRLSQIAEEAQQGSGKRILLCTVHPDNCFSLNNVLKQGYSVQKEIPIYGSVRYVLRKDIC